ncbi:MAG TPA: amino acid adenylation domain-containing protein, partial [Gemmatimonadales bacterium]|nr:amino acid adenylation domain-containing protein [Gemmatimonadales bacterium]
MQRITTPQSVPLPLTDLSTLAPAALHARAITEAEVRLPFDLGTGPLLRVQLLRLSAEEHVLLLDVHHIASDGWSSGIFERELSLAYAAFVKGGEPQLPALPIQYADYAAWQREWLQGEVLQAQLDYWKQQLADLPALGLPTDRPRPPIATHKGAHCSFDLPAHLCDALKALGRSAGTTLFMTLLAAFQVLLYRYSGQEDIAVGTPIAGRGRTEFEGLIGFFANTLVLRSDLSGNPSFRELLSRVREAALGAYTHQELPFEKLVEELAPARDMSRNPLFQVSFALQNAPAGALAFEGVEVNRVYLEGNTAKFDLYLALRESGAGLHGRWEYATDLFDASTIERMSGHLRQLLEAIVADPAQRIGHLPMLSAAERHQLLVEWNDTATDYPAERCIQQLFEAQVARTPEATALIFEDQRLSYAELNARANRLAHHLIALGVGPEVLVAVCLERSPEFVVSLLAILKAGGAYVPLDPAYPQQRLAFMLEDTRAPVLLTEQALLAQIPPSYAGRLVCMDRDEQLLDAQPLTNPTCRATAESLAYVIYTSGSTGRPKGVAVRQRGVARLVCEPNYVVLSPSETIAQVSNVAFDAATFEIWGALLNGARLAIIAQDAVLAPESLAAALKRYQISTLFLTTALFNHMSLAAPGAFRDVRQLLFGGESCEPERIRAVLEAAAPGALIHVYGPTETTTFATFHRVERVCAGERTLPIGRPISGAQVFILDRQGAPVPVGVAGEIHIGGPGVAAGYVNRPEETRARFITSSLEGGSETLLYRTGDRGRYRPDGAIEFL